MDSPPVISIALPVFNGARYLEAALRSIVEQTFVDWELIAVNDGSTDETEAILEKWAAKEGRIFAIHQENQGLPKALNRALAVSRGRLIARMDGDDIAAVRRLSVQVEYLSAYPDVGVVGSAVDLIDPKGRLLGHGRPPVEHGAIDAQLMRGNGSAIYHPTVLMRREVVEAVGGYDEESGLEDLDLFLRLAEQTRLANVCEPLLRYRLHLGSTNANRRERHARMTDDVVCRAYQRRGLDPVSAPRRRALVDTIGAVYEDWSMKASLAGRYRTAMVHAGNAFINEQGGQRWARLNRCMRFLVSRILRNKVGREAWAMSRRKSP